VDGPQLAGTGDDAQGENQARTFVTSGPARPPPSGSPSHPATIAPMAEAEGTLQEQLDEIGIQLAWVRDYL
jgi:hypothetical protein